MKHLYHLIFILLTFIASDAFAQQRNDSTFMPPAIVMDNESDSRVAPEENDTTIYGIVEELPQYPGGMPALIKGFLDNYVYPKQERKAKAQGTIAVKFVVEKDGSISKAQIVRSLSPACDAAAISALKSLKRFSPGKEKGKPVRTWLTLPVRIRLQ